MAKSARYYQGCNEALLLAVPPEARTILEVGCGEGILGGRLKAANSKARVSGIEGERDIAVRARQRLDQVCTLGIQTDAARFELAWLNSFLSGVGLEPLCE